MPAPYLGPRQPISSRFTQVEGYPESKDFMPIYWEVVRNYDGPLAPLPPHISSLTFLSGIPTGKISRDDVRAQFVYPFTEQAIIRTVVWGYERGRIGNNPDNMINALTNAGRMAETLNKIVRRTFRRGPQPAKRIIRLLNRAGKVGTSTGSKVAAMARLRALEGECVILDRQVIASIFNHRFVEFEELERVMMPRTVDGRNCLGERIATSFRRHTEFYDAYVREIAATAFRLNTTPEQVERFLFRTVPDMEPINEHWGRIQAKRAGLSFKKWKELQKAKKKAKQLARVSTSPPGASGSPR